MKPILGLQQNGQGLKMGTALKNCWKLKEVILSVCYTKA